MEWRLSIPAALVAMVFLPAGAAWARPAPKFKLKDSDGKPHTLEELRGNAVVIHFWASWCAPCLPEMPEIVKLATELGSGRFRVVAISLDEGWNDALRILPSKSLPRSLISLIDSGREVSTLYGSSQFPESYVLDERLEIVARLVGPQKWRSPLLRESLKKLIPL